MALTVGLEHVYNGEVRDNDGRLIVVTKDGATIGGGGGGSDPLSDGSDAGALPSKTLWIAGADGTVLRGVRVDSSGRIRTVVEGTPAVSVSNFPATQPVSGPLTDTQLRASAVPVSVSNFPGTQPVSGTVSANQGTPNSAANKWPISVTDGTNTAQVLNAAPGSDTGQSAVAVRVISQLGAGSGGGGGGIAQADKSAFTEGTTSLTPIGGVLNETISADPAEDQAAAVRITPKRAAHANLRRQDGTEIGTSTTPVRTDPTGTTTQPVSGSVSVSNFPATQPVSGTVTATGPLTDTQLRASAVPVSNATQLPSALVGGRLDVNIGNFTSGLALPIVGSAPAQQTVTWTSATALNTALTYTGLAPYGALTVGIVVPSTVTGGVVTLETTTDGTNWGTPGSVRIDNSDVQNIVPLAYWPGTNGVRYYLVSLDALTQFRIRLSTVIAGSGNVVVTIAPAQQGVEAFVATRSRKVSTYAAAFKTASRPYNLGFTFTANTRKQYATIHHAATAARMVRLRRVQVWITSVSTVAPELNIELVRITTAPATGAPAITPTVVDGFDAAAEATCLALPGTAATEGAVYSSKYMSLGITSTPPTTNPPQMQPSIELIEPGTFDDEAKVPTIRPGVLEGWAVVIDSTQASGVFGRVQMHFTEEPA